MLRKEYIVTLLAVLLSFGLAGTVFAGDTDMIRSSDVSTEAGNGQYHSGTSKTNLNPAARDQHLNDGSMAKAGSEAGNWQFRFDAPETKADMAADRYNYDRDALSAIGTEAGESEVFDKARGDRMRTICNC